MRSQYSPNRVLKKSPVFDIALFLDAFSGVSSAEKGFCLKAPDLIALMLWFRAVFLVNGMVQTDSGCGHGLAPNSFGNRIKLEAAMASVKDASTRRRPTNFVFACPA